MSDQIENTDAETVDVEALSKAIGDLRNAFDEESATEDAVEAVETEANDVIEAITKGADQILAQSREELVAREAAQTVLAKSLVAISESLVRIESALSTRESEIAKSLGQVADTLGEPAMAKGALTASTIAAPGDAAVGSNRSDVIRKAITDIQSDEIDNSRKQALGTAIALLESGAELSAVVSEYNL
jgi:hypothetical protein